VTVHLVDEVRGSMDVETGLSQQDSLSGFRVADRRRSWARFKTLSQDGLPSSLSLPSSNLVNLIVTVEDTGSGIPFEAQSRIFTPFMQVRPRNGSTGIGLSISKCLVGLMNGEIGFASVPKVGSTFTFTAVFNTGSLSSNEVGSQQKSNQSSSASAAFQGMRSLVVDPRHVRLKVAKYHIQRLGFNVEVAPDYNQSVSIISARNPFIDVVLIEQEVWKKDLKASSLFADRLKNVNCGRPPKLFVLANSVNLGRCNSAWCTDDTPSIIMKPLRASMVAASLQRAMGFTNKGNFCNGVPANLPLKQLLCGKKILVVDDNSTNRKVAAGALRKYGAEVHCVDSGRKAIEKLKPPHHFDACFMDIQMPEIDG